MMKGSETKLYDVLFKKYFKKSLISEIPTVAVFMLLGFFIFGMSSNLWILVVLISSVYYNFLVHNRVNRYIVENILLKQKNIE